MIHLVIFCKKKYLKFLPYCVHSINQFVEDEIVSKTIISENLIEFKDFKSIDDYSFWKIFDKQFDYEKLYDFDIFRKGWTKQQILKLNLDKIMDGDILVVDCDLLFLKPIKFIENKKYNFYFSSEYEKNIFLMTNHLLNLNKQTEKYESFITDFSIFNSCILKDIKSKIEEKHNKNWLLVVLEYVNNNENTAILSEYELYGNFMLKYHRDKVNCINHPIDYKMRVLHPNWNKLSPEDLLDVFQKKYKNYYQCIELNHDEVCLKLLQSLSKKYQNSTDHHMQ
jgi:hypothetical protein